MQFTKPQKRANPVTLMTTANKICRWLTDEHFAKWHCQMPTFVAKRIVVDIHSQHFVTYLIDIILLLDNGRFHHISVGSKNSYATCNEQSFKSEQILWLWRPLQINSAVDWLMNLCKVTLSDTYICSEMIEIDIHSRYFVYTLLTVSYN